MILTSPMRVFTCVHAYIVSLLGNLVHGFMGAKYRRYREPPEYKQHILYTFIPGNILPLFVDVIVLVCKTFHRDERGTSSYHVQAQNFKLM